MALCAFHRDCRLCFPIFSFALSRFSVRFLVSDVDTYAVMEEYGEDARTAEDRKRWQLMTCHLKEEEENTTMQTLLNCIQTNMKHHGI